MRWMCSFDTTEGDVGVREVRGGGGTVSRLKSLTTKGTKVHEGRNCLLTDSRGPHGLLHFARALTTLAPFQPQCASRRSVPGASMIRKFVVVVVLIALATVLVSLSSCGRDQQLESISVQPASETFGASNIPVIANAGAQVQLRALGNYIHPPVTKDITSKVTWNSNTPQMMTVDSAGLLTVTGLVCGATLVQPRWTLIRATAGSRLVGRHCHRLYDRERGSLHKFRRRWRHPALTLTFHGFGSGAVSSSPLGLSWSHSLGPRVTQSFPVGTPVTLTATPAGTSSFGNWSGCDSPGTTNPCTLNLTANRNVSVSFN